jgi:hypothetical protein
LTTEQQELAQAIRRATQGGKVWLTAPELHEATGRRFDPVTGNDPLGYFRQRLYRLATHGTLRSRGTGQGRQWTIAAGS